MDEDYRARRASSTFKRLRPEDFWFPLTPLSEWEHLDQEGVEDTDALLIVGEILLASNKALGKCRCKPSLLRSCWTNIHAWKGVFLRRVGVRMGSLSSKRKFSRENWSEISIYFAKWTSYNLFDFPAQVLMLSKLNFFSGGLICLPYTERPTLARNEYINFISKVNALLPHTTLFAQLSLLGLLYDISTKTVFSERNPIHYPRDNCSASRNWKPFFVHATRPETVLYHVWPFHFLTIVPKI